MKKFIYLAILAICVSGCATSRLSQTYTDYVTKIDAAEKSGEITAVQAEKMRYDAKMQMVATRQRNVSNYYLSQVKQNQY